MRNWEWCLNAIPKNEKTGISRVFSVDLGYLSDIGGRLRVVLCGWGLEVFGPMRRDGLR